MISIWTKVGPPKSQLLHSKAINNYIFYVILYSDDFIRMRCLYRILEAIKENMAVNTYFYPLFKKLINYEDSELIIDVIKTCRSLINFGSIKDPRDWAMNQCIQCRKLIIRIIMKYPDLASLLQSNLNKKGQSLYKLSEIVP